MSYTALYRRWRPLLFSDVVGQEHIVHTLTNQIESGRIAHAYLFTGSRGTGKTSTAKIFARAINCLSPKGAEACGTCTSCMALSNDENLDIIEIDAASNNGVDNIRDIRDKVLFAPTVGKYKVYIIDEVHMLSSGAFNALLKTLEEPPAHAVFILATTEVHKLPATILSRCQRFDFKLISLSDIANRLKYILIQSNADFDEEAVMLIARSAEGSMRDALSLADVCISYCGDKVHYEDVVRILGASDRSFLFEFADYILSSDVNAALLAVTQLTNEGRDIRIFIRDFMTHLRDILICSVCPASSDIALLPKDVQERLKKQAEHADKDRLLRAIEILATLESTIKLHTRPIILFETAVVRICTPQIEVDLSALRDRLAVLEKTLESGSIVRSGPTEVRPASKAAPLSEKSEPAKTVPKPVIKAPSGGSGEELWEALLARVKKVDMPLYSQIKFIKKAKREDNIFYIYIEEQDASRKTIVNNKAAVLQTELEALTGEKLLIKTADTQAEKKDEPDKSAQFLNDANYLFGEENIMK